MTRVAALFIYPLKSAAGIAVHELQFDELAIVNDRRFMLVDGEGEIITQREQPSLARVEATPGAGGTLSVSVDERESLLVEQGARESRRATIWKDEIIVADCGDVAAEWFSDYLGTRCRLVAMSESTERPLKQKFAGALSANRRSVALSDGSPALVLGTASLAELNRRLQLAGKPILGVERFRPNILLETAVPHAEDTWSEVRVGDVRLGIGSLCPRCPIPTVDQERGVKAGPEPLTTLASYRRLHDAVYFGVNATHESPGYVRVGDSVSGVATKPTQA